MAPATGGGGIVTPPLCIPCVILVLHTREQGGVRMAYRGVPLERVIEKPKSIGKTL